MRLFDLRITILSVTFFLRLFCQYPGVFYYLDLCAIMPGKNLFSFTIKASRKMPIGWRDAVRKFLCFQRWKLKSGGV